VGFRNHPIQDPLINRAGTERPQEFACIGAIKALDHKIRQSNELLRFTRLARRKDQPYRLDVQSTGDEGKDLRRRPIKPVRVIYDPQERPVAGGLRQQTECTECNQKGVRRTTTGQSECDADSLTLRCGQIVEFGKERSAQLLKSSKSHVHFGLHTRCARDPQPVGTRNEILQ
jgi:ribosomal protein L37AE/L43A